MSKYVVFILIILSVQCLSLPNRKIRQIDDDDYEDGLHFQSNGNNDDQNFIANSPNCPHGMTRSPWGKCISCQEYFQKFGQPGQNC